MITHSTSLKGAITCEAHRKYGELVAHKMKEIRPKYLEDPKFKRSKEILEEIRELESRERELAKEYHKLTGGYEISHAESDDSIIMKLSKLNTLSKIMRGIIDNKTEIEMSVPGFNPHIHLRNLEEFFKEELSYIK